MDATTMPSTPTLLEAIKDRFPTITFKTGEQFEWHPHEGVIIYDHDDPLFGARLLHEVGHAKLKHDSYDRDVDLISMERDAWQVARVELAPLFYINISGDVIHHDMDTYRDWLHERSTCPHCGSNGIQIKKRDYKCVTCLKSWRVNEARSCQLRRYRI